MSSLIKFSLLSELKNVSELFVVIETIPEIYDCVTKWLIQNPDQSQNISYVCFRIRHHVYANKKTENLLKKTSFAFLVPDSDINSVNKTLTCLVFNPHYYKEHQLPCVQKLNIPFFSSLIDKKIYQIQHTSSGTCLNPYLDTYILLPNIHQT